MKTQQMIDEELEMELLDQMDIEEEEEEEELDLEEEEDEDRGDEVDPDLPDDDPEEDDQDEGDEEPAQAKKQDDEDLDPDDLADLAGDDKKKANFVPHARFNEVNKNWQEERAERLRLEEELARMRGATPKPAEKVEPEVPAFDFDDAEKRLMEAQYEGNQDQAMAIRKEIRAAERAELERLADERAERLYADRKAKEEAEAQKQQQDREQESLKEAAAKAVSDYPFLDSSSDDANADAIEEVMALRDLYSGRGMSLAEALTKAVERVGPRYADEPDAAEEIDKKKANLSTEQIKRNLDREKRIPSRDAGIGERANKIDYESLTEEQFDQLSESEKRKARGDFAG